MYTDSAYWHNKKMDFKDRSHPLFVGSCGTYHLFTRPKLPTHRPRGRLDWQLLYVASGKAHFYFNGNEEIVTAGNMVLCIYLLSSAIITTVSTIPKYTGFILRAVM